MALDSAKKITADLLCLHLLLEKEMYVYEMAQELDRRSSGVLAMTEAAIYLCMYKLAEKGYVTDHRELVGEKKARMRVYYAITDAGREYYCQIHADYWNSVSAMQEFFGMGVAHNEQ